MFKIDNELPKNSNLWSFNENTNKLEFAYKDDLQQEYENLFSNIFPNINLDPATPQGQIITRLVQTDLAAIAYLENLANAFFFGGNGAFLDNWAWNLFRIKRKEGIPSSVNITIEGIAKTAVPENFLITDGEHNYKISKPVIIGDDGKIDVIFYAVENSDFIAPPNTINKIVTIVSGVERVNNKDRALSWIKLESDNSLFQRCVVFGSNSKNASFRSIMANVAGVDKVNRLNGAENPTNQNKTIKNIELTPHSICLVVDGGENEDIAQALFESRATGCDMVGDVEVSIIRNEQKYTYKFYRPTEVPLKFEIKVSAKGILIPSNFETQVKETIFNYINNLDIATTITQPMIANELILKTENINILEVKFSLKSGNVGYDSINLDLNQVAIVSMEDIKVSEVK